MNSSAAIAISHAVAASLRGARILIVDDDRIQCHFVARLLRDWEAEPHTAMTLADALRLYKERRPDLVLLDVMMPHIDGYKLAQMFKRDSTFVPVIMLTGLENVEAKLRGVAAGADEFLTKPVNALELQIRLSSMLRIKRLADELETANRSLSALATLDPLTKVANRRLLEQTLATEFQRAERSKHPLAIVMIDVDHFKRVNDKCGHPIGDKVLELIGLTLLQHTRATDLVGRFGGEEFMIIAPETTAASARELADRVRQLATLRTSEPEARVQGLPTVTFSAGIGTTEIPVSTVQELVRRADEALYRAKHQGRNCVIVFE